MRLSRAEIFDPSEIVAEHWQVPGTPGTSLAALDVLATFVFVLFIVLSGGCTTLRSRSSSDADIRAMASKPLQAFLATHQAADRLLQDELHANLPNRRLQLTTHRDRPSAPRAYHSYPIDGLVKVSVRDNYNGCDQYLLVLFEVLNTGNEPRFKELINQVRAGTITRAEFPRAIREVEFNAHQGLKTRLPAVELTPAEAARSEIYLTISGLPNEFEASLPYWKAAVPDQDYETAYGFVYNFLRVTRWLPSSFLPIPK